MNLLGGISAIFQSADTYGAFNAAACAVLTRSVLEAAGVLAWLHEPGRRLSDEAIDIADACGHSQTRMIATVAAASQRSRQDDIGSAASGLLDGLAFARSVGSRTVILPIAENAGASRRG